jgi:two-component system phosphate regulon sensor histidine kinase PhoR
VHLNEERGLLFVAAKHRGADNETYFLVARLDLGYIRAYLISDELRKLGRTNRVALVDADSGKALPEMVFGGSEPRTNERFLYNEPFGRLLYAWNLRLAHQEEEMLKLEKRLEWEKIIQPLFVLLSTVIIAVGLGIVMLSVVAERRASRLKSDFIANVSHELKTPLSLIRMFGELVATGRHKGEEMVREYGGIITRESERLSHLIDNVLDFARLERGKASYDFVEGDLGMVLERSLDICRYRLDKDRIRLRVLVDRDLPPVRMDDNAITLVILNLVDNALKYGADGGAVDVALERAPGGVVLTVRDFGPGIPKEEQGRIFERFYRAQSARDRNVRGSGIGLSLVRHIAEAHGGRVSVESPVRGSTGADNGSIFRVFLPAPIVATGLGSGQSAEAEAVGGVKMDGASEGGAVPSASSSEWRPIKS